LKHKAVSQTITGVFRSLNAHYALNPVISSYTIVYFSGNANFAPSKSMISPTIVKNYLYFFRLSDIRVIFLL